MTQLTAQDLIAIRRNFVAEHGTFHGFAVRRHTEPLVLIDVLYRVLYPESAADASGVDAAIAMIPNEDRRERVREFVQALPAIPDTKRGGVRGTDRWGPLGDATTYLSTILFGSVRPPGETFDTLQGVWRLEMLGIQYRWRWEPPGITATDKAFVKPNGDPVDEEMRWAIVIPSLEILTVVHKNGGDLFPTFGLRFDAGVSIRTVTAFLADKLRAFSRRSERFPFTTYLGGASVDDIATIFCATQIGIVPDEPVKRLQLISATEVGHGGVFPADLPWGPRPPWLEWTDAWPTPHWRPKLPYVPNRFESDTYNAAAQKAHEFGASAATTWVTATTLDGVVDYCRGILETLVDAETRRTVMPSSSVRQPKRALHMLFLLKAIDERGEAQRAYDEARDFLLRPPALISKSTTITRKVYEPLSELVVDRVLFSKLPSHATVAWAVVHALDILVIFSDMHTERVELAREVVTWKEAGGASVARTPYDALVALAKETPGFGLHNPLSTSIAIAFSEYGYEIGIHELSYTAMVPAGEGIRRVLATAPGGGDAADDPIVLDALLAAASIDPSRSSAVAVGNADTGSPQGVTNVNMYGFQSVIMTVPHATCPVRGGEGQPRAPHPCDTIAVRAAQSIYDSQRGVFFYATVVAASTPRATCDLNRDACRNHPWRAHVRRVISEALSSTGRNPTVFVLDVHSFPPDAEGWSAYEVVLLDDDPTPTAYTESLARRLKRAGVAVAIGRGRDNDIQDEARAAGHKSVLVEFNERLGRDASRLDFIAAQIAQWFEGAVPADGDDGGGGGGG